MKNQLTLLIGIVVLVILVCYMFFFQVRYDQVAVLTTFEGARAPEVEEATGEVVDWGSVIDEPGVRFKWPWPIQRVYTYPRQVQLLEVQPEQMQTADDYSVIVTTYLTWRIVDPYSFFREVESIETAQRRLLPMMRDVRSVIADYRFDELVNPDASQLKLEEVESEALEMMQRRLAGTDYGIEAKHVGIRRILLPEDTTEQVFERMRTTRQTLAEAARAQGRARAEDIRSEAQTARERILAFAERRAEAIRDEGRSEAASYVEAFQADEDFAIFLRQIDALRQISAHNTTFVLDADSLSVLNWFREDPGSLELPEADAGDVAEQLEEAERALSQQPPLRADEE